MASSMNGDEYKAYAAEIEIGISTWLNQPANRQESSSNPALHRIHYTDKETFEEALREFLQASGQTKLSLRTLGAYARAAGCVMPNEIAQHFIRIHDNEYYFYPPLPSDWAAIDPTCPSVNEDEAMRYHWGPGWKNMSCAYDCMVMVGIFLNVGRTKACQMTYAEETRLTTAGEMLIGMVRSAWGKWGQEARNKARDMFKGIILELEPGMKKKLYPAIETLYELTFEGLRLTNFHTIRADVSQTGALTISQLPREVNLLQIYVHVILGFGDNGFSTAQEAIQDFFSVHTKSHGRYQRVVMGRMPGILVVNADYEGGQPPDAGIDPFSLLTPISINYQQPSTSRTIHYRPVGFIKLRFAHFTMAFLTPRWEIIFYDGDAKDQGGCRKIGTLKDGLDSGDDIRLVFYRKTGDA